MLTPKVAFHRSVVATVDCAGVVDLYHPLAIATACIGNRIDDSISKIPQVLWECYHKSCGNVTTNLVGIFPQPIQNLQMAPPTKLVHVALNNFLLVAWLNLPHYLQMRGKITDQFYFISKAAIWQQLIGSSTC